MNENENFSKLREIIDREKRIIQEIKNAHSSLKKHPDEKEMVYSQINSLKGALRTENKNFLNALTGINIPRPLNPKSQSVQIPQKNTSKAQDDNSFKAHQLVKKEMMSGKSKEQAARKKEIGFDKKASSYIMFANKLFADYSLSLIRKGWFQSLDRDLEKSSMNYLPKSYISVLFLTTLISGIVAIFLTIILLFFSFSLTLPIISLSTEDIGIRFLKVVWILLALPTLTFLFMYFYPSLEKKSLESRINQELPFVTINMAAISGSMLDPTRVFEIIMSTKEYPALEEEFKKIINGVNVLGYDLVTTLRSSAFNSPSKKLSELLNGLATTINSGGNLARFFDERAKSLLFEYKLEREKSIRASETFMDIYISVVIAAPMILMLLLVIIQISGIGIQLSTTAITILVVLAVTIVNIMFITFLHVRQSKEG